MENNQTKEKLLAEIGRLKKELKKKKKYGLVWEDKPEDVVEMCKEKLPVLKEIKGKEIITDKNKPMNLLIEGDNYHALSVLNYTHKGKIDVIYIDPPYNTKQEGFIYNDKRVDLNDGYRHSKWLNFMEKRLILAKNLLSESGVIFISIDDNEYAQLKMLCDKILLEKNFIENFCWNKTQTPPSLSHKSRNNIDYILCYEKNKNSKKYFGKSSSNSDAPLLNKGNGIKTLYFPIGSIKFNIPDGLYEKGKYGDIEIIKNFKIKGGINSEIVEMKGEFKWQQSNLENELSNGSYLLIKSKRMSIRYQKTDDRVNNMLPNKMIDSSFGVGTNEYATKQVKELGLVFSFPKPTSLISFLIKMAKYEEKQITILDFFAGSGTTGHAVIELNKADNGNRKFIICTNNEGRIADDVCYPRIEKVIKGYKNTKKENVAGLGGNLKYFKTDFVDYKESTDRNKIKLTKEAVEMLCVKEGTFELVQDGGDFKIFKNHDHYTGIIFDQLAIEDFKKAVKDIKGKISVYIFSLGDDSFEDEFEDIKQKVKLSPIPEAILKVYRRIYK